MRSELFIGVRLSCLINDSSPKIDHSSEPRSMKIINKRFGLKTLLHNLS